jgi:DNA replication and repair protein RecF
VRLESLKLTDFRNYVCGSFDFAPGVNVIIGENGRGKTNILEAVYILSGCRSWRGVKNEDLVRFGCMLGRVEAKAVSRGRDFGYHMTFMPGKRTRVLINDVQINRKANMSDIIRCVLFSPEDLMLIKGGASNRRSLMDDCLCQLSPIYDENLGSYEKILKNKQKLLRDGEDFRVLPELNLQLAHYSTELVCRRYELVDRLNTLAKSVHSDISGGKEKLTLRYNTMSCLQWVTDRSQIINTIYTAMKEMESAEIASKSCLVGVHRDDIEVYINGKDARRFASQGQSRTAAIAIKFAQRELLRDGEDYPLLLLDDVLSELDEARQGYILKNTRQGQTIITCCQMPETIGEAKFMYIPDEFIAGENAEG